MSNSSTHVIAPEIVQGLGLIGKIVHVPYRSGQFRVHSVEGFDWYAFDRDGETVLDLNMTASESYREPLATIVPVDHKIGDGQSEGVVATELVRGPNLVHPSRFH